MAFFCKIGNYGIVEKVVVINDIEILDGEGNLSESIGQQKCVELYGGKTYQWIQTWYSGPRGIFGSKGYKYDYETDRFYPPQPSSLHIWNEELYDWIPG